MLVYPQSNTNKQGQYNKLQQEQQLLVDALPLLMASQLLSKELCLEHNHILDQNKLDCFKPMK